MAIRRHATSTALLAALMLAQAVPVLAQSVDDRFQQGVAAYEKSEYAKAAELWQPLAEDGEVEAMRNLAQLYRLGLGVRKNDKKAFELYHAAAEKGLAEAQVNTAFLYLTGEGVEKNSGEAALWFARAADQGDALAQFNLGLMYEKGVGVEQDSELARELYQLAANQGQQRALARLDAIEAKLPPDGGASARRARMEQEAKVAEAKAAEAKAEEASAEETSAPETAAAPKETTAPKAEKPAAKPPAKAPAATETAAQETAPAKPDAEAPAASGTRATVTVRKEPPREKGLDDLPGTEGKPVLIMRRAADPEPVQTAEAAPAESIETSPAPVAKAAAPAPAADPAPKAKPAPALLAEGPAESATPKPKAERLGTGAVPKARPEPVMEMRTAALPRPMPAPASLLDFGARGDRVTRVKRAERSYADGNFGEALALVGPLAAEGMPVAEFLLGRMYNRGEGVRLDRFEAYSLWRSAAESGSGRAATALANLASRFDPQELLAAEAYHRQQGR